MEQPCSSTQFSTVTLTKKKKHFHRNLFKIAVLQYKAVQIWPGLFVCKQAAISPGHIWTTL
jgi:hypothetical protein